MAGLESPCDPHCGQARPPGRQSCANWAVEKTPRLELPLALSLEELSCPWGEVGPVMPGAFASNTQTQGTRQRPAQRTPDPVTGGVAPPPAPAAKKTQK